LMIETRSCWTFLTLDPYGQHESGRVLTNS
jgi:hypothetical protein